MCPPKAFVYEVDRADRLRDVSPEWVEFAKENDAKGLNHSVLGESLWPYVGGEATRHVYQQLFFQVRKDGRERTVPFRCDSPRTRRFMELTIRRIDGGALQVRSVLLREEPRDAVPLLDVSAKRSGELLRMCAWCKKVEVGDEWLEVEEAIAALDLFGAPEVPSISHAMCPECERIFLKELGV